MNPTVQQSQFFDLITSPNLAEDASSLFSVFSPQRLAAYRRNHQLNRTHALSALFPVVTALVGQAFFEEMAAQYVSSQRAISPNLHDLGHDFPDWMASYPPAISLPYLPDVARLDWRVHCAFYAKDASPLSPSSLASVPPEKIGGLIFVFHPAVCLIQSNWPLADIWEYHQPEQKVVQVDLNKPGGGVLVTRIANVVTPIRLSTVDTAVTNALISGCGFAEAVDIGLAIDEAYQPLSTLQCLFEASALIDIQY
ncbi:DNA-binding domain-containing protein [Leeia sp. TBRC 13508]|uniref:DNA-binding domain-containing protein n=1 Tax=Leeia speluncae TaxID=2884804 RepID=A0ABS8D536_9NEIS|nr:DNA-binding domain-containing protein [Leeia speluncae]MCB6183308.1 DNA-binding domain-containing protein [Leeia speluncae]